MAETKEGCWLRVGGVFHYVSYSDGKYSKETACKQLGVDARTLARSKAAEMPDDACEGCAEVV